MKKLSLIMASALALCTAGMALAGCGEGGEKTLTLEDGNVYVGQVKDGVPNGTGTLTDYLGSEWKGNFVDGKLEGYGTYLGYDLTEYEGFFKNGLFEGYGHRIAANGDNFTGMFSGGKANGVGRMEYTTMCIYEGGWKNDYMDGMGWMTWPVGDIYFGQWIEGQPAGFGCKLFYATDVGSVKDNYETYNIYVGGMDNNQMDGWGIMKFYTAGIYMGKWEKGIRNDDNGIYYFEEKAGLREVKFIGAFSKSKNNGWIWGEGTMYYNDGTSKTGTWEGTTCTSEHPLTGHVDPAALAAERASVNAQIVSNEYYAGAINAG